MTSNSTSASEELLEQCDTLMLDMDGTLLDLAYDNFMWLEHIPAEYARENDLPEDVARRQLLGKAKALEGRLDWYCLDYWSELLGLDVVALHRNNNARIAFLPGAKRFLERVREHEIRLLLVSNSHRGTLDLKNEVTGVADYFDRIYISHDMGYAKEHQSFWENMQQIEGFDRKRTLFVDDNVTVLTSAETYGVRHLRGISRPDTSAPAQHPAGFDMLQGVSDLLRTV